MLFAQCAFPPLPGFLSTDLAHTKTCRRAFQEQVELKVAKASARDLVQAGTAGCGIERIVDISRDRSSSAVARCSSEARSSAGAVGNTWLSAFAGVCNSSSPAMGRTTGWSMSGAATQAFPVHVLSLGTSLRHVAHTHTSCSVSQSSGGI